MPTDQHPVIIIGAGPAGLSAALELARHDVYTVILEQASQVGGLSRTEIIHGFRFDIGGHRFFTKVQEIEHIWRDTLKNDLIDVERSSDIFHHGKLFPYPLALRKTFSNLGVMQSLCVLGSYLKAKAFRQKKPQNLEDWLVHRFGRKLYELFFRDYTQKVWGIPANKLLADWGAQRIRNLSLLEAFQDSITGRGRSISLAKRFLYPRQGAGMMWEKMLSGLKTSGVEVQLRTKALRLRMDKDSGSCRVQCEHNGKTIDLPACHIISSAPLRDLFPALDPPPSRQVCMAASALRYRDLIVVCLIVDKHSQASSQWVYVQDSTLKVGRVQNLSRWSSEMSPFPEFSGIAMEYFCNRGDELWMMTDNALIDLASREYAILQDIDSLRVNGGGVIRQPMAYPVYDHDYTRTVNILRRALHDYPLLTCIGRNGMHRYNNMDHSMLTGLLAARNILGEQHDLWDINTDEDYHERLSNPQS